jgi:hypothetical protein
VPLGGGINFTDEKFQKIKTSLTKMTQNIYSQQTKEAVVSF